MLMDFVIDYSIIILEGICVSSFFNNCPREKALYQASNNELQIGNQISNSNSKLS